MSIVIDIADAVVAMLNGATLSQVFTAERHYVPIHELKDLVDITVSVVPRTLERPIIDRSGRSLFMLVLDVGIQRTIGRGPMTSAELNLAIDPLMTLAEEIADLFSGQPLTIAALQATCTSVANVPIFAPEHADELRVFTSVVSLTFKVGR